MTPQRRTPQRRRQPDPGKAPLLVRQQRRPQFHVANTTDTADLAAPPLTTELRVDHSVTSDNPNNSNDHLSSAPVVGSTDVTDFQSKETPTGGSRVLSLLRPELNHAQVLAAVLTGLVGFALVTQLQQSPTANLSSRSQDDLVRLLADVSARAEILRQEVATAQAQKAAIETSSDRKAAASQAAQQRLRTLQILAGTIPVTGPGIRMTVTAPDGSWRVGADTMTSMVHELRAAQAEAIEINGVRVAVGTYFTDNPLTINGTPVTAPLTITAIGSPNALDTAMKIPGGVVQSFQARNAQVVVTQQKSISVLATVPTPNSKGS